MMGKGARRLSFRINFRVRIAGCVLARQSTSNHLSVPVRRMETSADAVPLGMIDCKSVVDAPISPVPGKTIILHKTAGILDGNDLLDAVMVLTCVVGCSTFDHTTHFMASLLRRFPSTLSRTKGQSE
jgi:hypothetical protein